MYDGSFTKSKNCVHVLQNGEIKFMERKFVAKSD